MDDIKLPEPVAYLTYKGYLLHAADPKVAEHSDPEPLYDADQVRAAVLADREQRNADTVDKLADALRAALQQLERDWHTIDAEYGPAPSGLESLVDSQDASVQAIIDCRAALAEYENMKGGGA